MSDALEEPDGKVSIGGRNINNLRFAVDIGALAEEEQELEALVESLDKTCTKYKMDISAEKTKLMTNSANGIQRDIKVKGQKLGTVTSFKYLGAVVSDDGSKPEVLSRVAQATAALTQGRVKGKRKRGRQKKRWEDNIKEWTGMDFASSTRAAENRLRWKGIVADSSVVARRHPKVMG